MKILIDENITAAQHLFDPHGEVVRMPGREIRRRHLTHIDALIIRSITQVDAALLQETAVQFVGSTTIGTDHMDTPWLEANGIRWTSAPGCNADSAAQYTLAMIWLACERLNRDPAKQSVGIIGRGNVGSRLQRLLRVLGLKVVANDPPLAEKGASGLVSLPEALAQDIVCLHVPLERGGEWPTFQMINETTLKQMRPGTLLVNSARGDVIDGHALTEVLESNRIVAALDVWPGEPRIDPRLLSLATVATPHVAGYSDDGKYKGAKQVYAAFCSWTGQAEQSAPALPGGPRELLIPVGKDPLKIALEATCFVEQHDALLKRLADSNAEGIAKGFDTLRRDYPGRRDFAAWKIHCESSEAATRLKRLGFGLES